MALRDARTIGPAALEERRQQAVKLHQEGLSRLKIAEIVGVHRNTVGEWITAWRTGGEAALKAGTPGRPVGSGRRLSGFQAATIKRLITDKTPDQLKFSFALWTRDAVRLLIKERYSIDMPIRTVGAYLKRWGFTPQKPIRRFYERCNAKVRRWLDEQYPALRKRAAADGAEIYWGDETGFRSDDVNGRGFAPRGQTPVRRAKATPEKINMISAVTNRGAARFMFYQGRMHADRLIAFLKRLIHDAKRKVYLILDNLRVHHAKKVNAWVAERTDQIELAYLPAYSPELNPDEYLNNDLKALVSKRPDRRNKGSLEDSARFAMRSLQRQPARIANYFHAPAVRYAS
jgi:transposase